MFPIFQNQNLNAPTGESRASSHLPTVHTLQVFSAAQVNGHARFKSHDFLSSTSLRVWFYRLKLEIFLFQSTVLKSPSYHRKLTLKQHVSHRFCKGTIQAVTTGGRTPVAVYFHLSSSNDDWNFGIWSCLAQIWSVKIDLRSDQTSKLKFV